MTTNDMPWAKSYPPQIGWNMDLPPLTMPDLFAETVQVNGPRTALNFMGKKLTYAETGALARKVAKGLQGLGVGKGVRVGLCLPNTPFYVAAYYGTLMAGATVVNFNPLYAEKEIAEQIADSGAEIMVTLDVPQVQPKIEKMVGTTPLKTIISCDLADALPPVKAMAFHALRALKGGREKNAACVCFQKLTDNDGHFSPPAIAPGDVAVFQYTGGTTGIPKAAMLTHANLTANIRQAQAWFLAGRAPKAGEKTLSVLPFFHVFSMTVQMNLTLRTGGELVMLPKFELKSLLKTIAREKPGVFAGVPTLYKAVISSHMTRKYDLSSLRLCVSGGAPLPEGTLKDFKTLTGLDLVEGYGLSETSPLATGNPVYGVKKVNSIGLPVPRTEISIRHLETGALQPLNAEGEICIRGPQVMQGYWNRPDETAKVMTADGFLRTGDVGYMDDDGYVFIVDRIKDMIIASGFKVFPRKVEEAILTHPAVSEVMVAGLKHEYRGETVKAWIVPREGSRVDENELKKFLEERLAPYEMPKMIDFRETLPKTLIGKPDRKALLAEEKAKG